MKAFLGHGPGVPCMETGDENATLLTLCDRMRCSGNNVLASITPYTFISHTKMSNYIA